jgi:hypothetical protein
MNNYDNSSLCESVTIRVAPKVVHQLRAGYHAWTPGFPTAASTTFKLTSFDQVVIEVDVGGAEGIASLHAALEIRVTSNQKPIQLSIFAHKVGHGWKARLRDAQSRERCVVPIATGLNMLGIFDIQTYSISFFHDDHLERQIDLLLAQFEEPDAIFAGASCMREGRFARALSIFKNVFELYPSSRELWDLLWLTRAIVAFRFRNSMADPELGQLRCDEMPKSPGDQLLEQTQSSFGSPNIANIIAAAGDPTKIDLAQMDLPNQQGISIPLLEALRIFAKVVEVGNGPLLLRLQVLSDAVNGMRGDVSALKEVVGASFEPFLSRHFGTSCWGWFDDDVRTQFSTAEYLYRSTEFKWVEGVPNYYLACCALFKGIEELFHSRLDGICGWIREALLQPNAGAELARRFGVEFFSKPISKLGLGEKTKLLNVGWRLCQERPDVLTSDLAAVYSGKRDDTVAAPTIMVPLRWFYENIRNPGIHGNACMGGREILMARKIILGIDEFGVGADFQRELDRIEPDTWRNYGGIARLIWQALGKS